MKNNRKPHTSYFKHVSISHGCLGLVRSSYKECKDYYRKHLDVCILRRKVFRSELWEALNEE